MNVRPGDVDLSFENGGVRFANPIFTASGTWGYGLEFGDIVDASTLGGVVTKTITVEPRSGNPQPRVRELEHGVLNSIGLENVGLAAFLQEKLPQLRARAVSTVVSLAGRDESEFGAMIDALATHAGWQGVELNLSCPNVAHGGLDFGQDAGRVERITQIARKALPPQHCLWVKLTPNVSSIGVLARAAEQGGADAVTCINTVLGMAIDLRRRAPVFPRGIAGYSGPAILPIALAKVWEARRAISIPVVGVGGISSIEDILAFFVAGADAVQVGTMLFGQPDLAHELLGKLQVAMAELGAKHPRELRAV